MNTTGFKKIQRLQARPASASKQQRLKGRVDPQRSVFMLMALALTFHPFGAGADNGPLHQASQNPWPILLGTSGGNVNDKSFLYCCSGTLGALVRDSSDTHKYILSNNHVLARTNKAVSGEDITHPGHIDQACQANSAVADLSAFKTISFTKGGTNTIDAAIAEVRTGTVDPQGTILDIGAVSGSIIAPTLGMAVQKSGRTTGWTTGTISSIDVTVKVGYPTACGSGRTKAATFVKQFAVTGASGPFSAGGDSGSLIVANTACPAAVGLLFAGSSSGATKITFANPIGEVLSGFGVSLVGGCSSNASREGAWFDKLASWLFPHVIAQGPTEGQGPSVDPATLIEARRVKEQHERALLQTPGVVGAGIGLSEAASGRVVIEIYVARDTPDLRQTLPPQLDHTPVRIVETGPILAEGMSCGETPE